MMHRYTTYTGSLHHSNQALHSCLCTRSFFKTFSHYFE